MSDQAAELRKLALAEARMAAHPEQRPRLLVITGAKGGVGATTMAVNLAVALADHGARVVLVDADPHCAGVASLCGVDEPHGLADVLTARRDIHEVLVRGPAGIQLAPGVWSPTALSRRGSNRVRGPVATSHSPRAAAQFASPPSDAAETVDAEDLFSERAAMRLLRQLSGLGRHAEWAVLDAGHGPGALIRGLWTSADVAVMVTTSESLSVMDAYAGLKRLSDTPPSSAPCLLVNHTRDREEALDTHSRIEHACRRFLGSELRFAGHVPADPHVAAAAEQRKPVVSWAARSISATALSQIAAALMTDASTAANTNPLEDGGSGSWRVHPIVA